MLNKFKKSLVLVISISIVLFNVLITTEIVSAVEGKWGEGDGKTAATAYVVEDSLDLELLATNVNNGNEYKDTYFLMTKDIDLSNYKSDPGWIPIANRKCKFRGKFDGAGNKITGLYIKSTDTDCGLFGFISFGSEIKNVGVELLKDSGISGEGNVGGLVGTNDGGNIENCYVIGNITCKADRSSIGGLVGNHYSGNIKNCYTIGEVKSKGEGSYVGGLVGTCDSGSIENSYSESTVSAYDKSDVGGFVGLNDNVYIYRCYATGKISGSGHSVGGFLGENNRSIIKQCFATGDVYCSLGFGHIGGLVGKNCGSVIECFSSGSITDLFDGKNNSTCCGGLVGGNGDYYDNKERLPFQEKKPASTGGVSNSYTTGIVKNLNNSYTCAAYYEVLVGGLSGLKHNENLSVSYWCIDDIDQKALQNAEKCDKVKRLTKLQMVGDSAQKNMDTLDFTDIWQTREADGTTYYFPQLKFFTSSKASDKMRAASLASVSVGITDEKADTKVISQPNIPDKEEKGIKKGTSHSIDLLKSDEAYANILQIIFICHMINPLLL